MTNWRVATCLAGRHKFTSPSRWLREWAGTSVPRRFLDRHRRALRDRRHQYLRQPAGVSARGAQRLHDVGYTRFARCMGSPSKSWRSRPRVTLTCVASSGSIRRYRPATRACATRVGDQERRQQRTVRKIHGGDGDFAEFLQHNPAVASDPPSSSSNRSAQARRPRASGRLASAGDADATNGDERSNQRGPSCRYS